jgi:hypothetical protein
MLAFDLAKYIMNANLNQCAPGHQSPGEWWFLQGTNRNAESL